MFILSPSLALTNTVAEHVLKFCEHLREVPPGPAPGVGMTRGGAWASSIAPGTSRPLAKVIVPVFSGLGRV